jgi:hypothetical protein
MNKGKIQTFENKVISESFVTQGHKWKINESIRGRKKFT